MMWLHLPEENMLFVERMEGNWDMVLALACTLRCIHAFDIARTVSVCAGADDVSPRFVLRDGRKGKIGCGRVARCSRDDCPFDLIFRRRIEAADSRRCGPGSC